MPETRREPWENAIYLIFDVTKLLVPVLTGFMLIVAGTMVTILEKGLGAHVSAIGWTMGKTAATCGLVALSMLIAVLPMLIKAVGEADRSWCDRARTLLHVSIGTWALSIACYAVFVWLAVQAGFSQHASGP